MASADTENASGVHATGSAAAAPVDALETRIDELLKDAENKVQPFDQGEPIARNEGDVPGPPIDEPFDLAKLSTELESALRQAEAAAREEREAERQIPVITPEAIVAVAVSATAEAGVVGPDGEPLPLIDLEALDHALAQAADAVGFGIGGIELESPAEERTEEVAHIVDVNQAPVEIPEPAFVPPPAPEPVVEQVIEPTPMMRHAKALANGAETQAPAVPEVASAPVESVVAAVVEPQLEVPAEAAPQVEVVEGAPVPAEPEPVAYSEPTMEPAPEPVAPPVPKRAPEPAPNPAEPKQNPLAGAVLGVLRMIASPLTVMSPAVRDLVGWLGLLTAFNAACVWVFVMLIGPGSWPTASAQASPTSHKESAGDAHGHSKPAAKDSHGGGHGAAAKQKDTSHGAPAKKDTGHGAPSKKDAGHGASSKKAPAHGASKEKKKAGGHH